MRQNHLQRLGMFAVIAFAAAGSGCASMNNTEKGAVGGGLGGAAIGGLAGAASGRPVAGALIGGAVGTAAGGLIGNGVDKEEKRDRDIAQAAALADAQAQQQRLGVFDVIRLAQEGQDDTVIINQIRRTGSSFDLTTSDLSELKRAGVSSRVIAEMQTARPAARPQRVVIREPAPIVYDSGPVYVRPAPVVVVGPPRPYYYGGGYYHRGPRW